jgi:hypothetical protein
VEKWLMFVPTGGIYKAKVIVENRSFGVRVVQCRISFIPPSGGEQFIDYANVTLKSGTNTTVPLISSTPNLVHGAFTGTVNCRVISAAKDNVVAGWVKVHTQGDSLP